MTLVLLSAVLGCGVAGPAAGATALGLQTSADGRIEAEQLTLAASNGQVFSDTSASGGRGLLIWSNAAGQAQVTLPVTTALIVRARGDLCAGAPQMVVTVDGTSVLSVAVAATNWTDYPVALPLAAGSHSLSVAYTNDFMGGGCDRNLRVDTLTFVPVPVSSTGFQGEDMSLPAGSGQAVLDSAAAGGKALLIWSNATAGLSVRTSGVTGFTVRARGDLCLGAPEMKVSVDNVEVLTTFINASAWTSYPVTQALTDGVHSFSVTFPNDAKAPGCDRNLYVDELRFSTGSPPPVPSEGNPFSSRALYVAPQTAAKSQADAWRSSRPADAAQMDKIARNPQAVWFGSWNSNLQADVATYVNAAAGANAMPVLVAYNIPQRDCGGFSSGGAASASAYQSWVRSFRAGIGTHAAAVLLEPDALASMDCLSSADQDQRVALLSDAVSVLSGASIAVYIDAGHSGWQSSAVMAQRLTRANVAAARGFSLNISNFNATSDELGFGQSLVAALGGKHFVVDTSRNGLGANGEWCNPPGRALGPQPTVSTANSAADAYLWVKTVGESDGSCNGGPGAGQWWGDYALGVAQRAAYGP